MHGVFCNPNIYPQKELDKRRLVYENWAHSVNLPITVTNMPHTAWEQCVSADLSKPGRCQLCYEMRLGAAAKAAARGEYDCFTTTLLVSPYQDQQQIIRAIEKGAQEYGASFLGRNFRPGYLRSRQMARGAHLYMQKYCGCEYSRLEGR